MDVKIYDNFLSSRHIKELKDNIFSSNFPWYYQEIVANKKSRFLSGWDYYHSHRLYNVDHPASGFFDSIYDIIIPKIKEVTEYHSLIRLKVNYYPYTETVKEHTQHTDYRFSHYGGILSLNTCNGFTRLFDDTIINSVENKFFIFDPSKPHNSSTTSDCKRRVNININWL